MMTMHSSNKILPLLLCLLLVTGCKKGWLDVNYNPRDLTSTDATPDLILAPLLERAIAVQETRFLQHWMGYWAYYHFPSGHALQTYDRTQIDGDSFSGEVAPEIAFLETRSRDLRMTFYTGIAKVLRVLAFQRAVDVVNSMPYKDAFISTILQPRYDDGLTIYEDLMRQLDEATTLIKGAKLGDNIKISVADIMFHGEQAKWIKFINTIKLRLLIHQANRTDRAAYITAEIAKIKNEGSGFLESGQDASVNPGYIINKKLSYYFGSFSSHNQYGGGDYNPLMQMGSREWAHANVFAMNLLKQNNDPRQELFYSTIDIPVPSGAPEPFPQPGRQDLRGNKVGLYVNSGAFPYQDGAYISSVGGSRNSDIVKPEARGIIKGRDMADWVMTSIESKFLQAEAIQRGWLPGIAEEAYKDAVKESFRWLNAGGNATAPALSDAIFDTWYNAEVTAGNVNVSWAAAPDKYKLLMFQKYMAFNGIEPLESWTDYRRNGRYPDVPISIDPARVGNTLPFRLLYNSNEYIVNAANVNAVGPVNIFTSKIWWMP
ncbi:SusD/RagB family nutrient-binding outer membrane lipoprotein [Chitinophaga sp. SYP-B3965]|uniref:SusD/RagB family nutrient-binding outer membrane lipoprotein n=1 Tax=Chitinophaga sp. SYP-B3965 TaxID=2663120 RepID=UPI001564A7F8|nr:SusD/RagB family nutrient-binding outer membrane lipoprotein [Chitinophaga sp. SYP-B3965]